MQFDFMFFFNSVCLGVGLAMDAFSVSLANGLNEPNMKRTRMAQIAGIFAFFQALMPMIGWFFVHTIVQYFKAFEACIPWIALILLSFIGIQMLLEGKEGSEETVSRAGLSLATLFIQGVATSIDALSVGFTIANYGLAMALIAAFIIALVTFPICMGGLIIGKKAGTKLAGKANILGGVVLICIGLEIFITSFF